jgi:hypothetical protein
MKPPRKPFMVLPLSLGLLWGNIACWGIYLAPRSRPSLSNLIVLGFLIAASVLTWSYRESYYHDRVVVRYLPFVSREVYWEDIQSFSVTPILRFRTAQSALWLPATPPILQSFIDEHLRQLDRHGFVKLPQTTLLGGQLCYSAVWAVVFILSIAGTAPFLVGGPLHKWWESAGRILLLCDLQLLLAVLFILGQTAPYFSQSASRKSTKGKS